MRVEGRGHHEDTANVQHQEKQDQHHHVHRTRHCPMSTKHGVIQRRPLEKPVGVVINAKLVEVRFRKHRPCNVKYYRREYAERCAEY